MRALIAALILIALPAFAALYGRVSPDTGQFMLLDSETPPPMGKGWFPYTLTPAPPFNPDRFKLVEVTPPPVIGLHYVQTWEKKRLTKAERDAIADAKELAELAESAAAVLKKLDEEKEITKEEIADVLRYLLKRRGLP